MESLESELEHKKEIIIHLKTELASKNKEISLLKVDKNKRLDEYQKSIKVIEGILKKCKKSSLSQKNFMFHISPQNKKTMKLEI